MTILDYRQSVAMRKPVENSSATLRNKNAIQPALGEPMAFYIFAFTRIVLQLSFSQFHQCFAQSGVFSFGGSRFGFGCPPRG